MKSYDVDPSKNQTTKKIFNWQQGEAPKAILVTY